MHQENPTKHQDRYQPVPYKKAHTMHHENGNQTSRKRQLKRQKPHGNACEKKPNVTPKKDINHRGLTCVHEPAPRTSKLSSHPA